MYRIAKVVLIVAGAVALFAAAAFAQAPHTLMYQGKLATATGPVSSPVSVTFRIYDALTEGTLLWSETHGSLTPNDVGVFTVQLGSIVAFEPGIFDGSVRYLGITVGTDEEMTPRQPITSVPYSLQSNVPGVGYAFVSGYEVLEATTSAASLTVNVPAPGFLLLEATGWGEIYSGALTGTSYYWVTISDDATMLDLSSAALHYIEDAVAYYFDYETLAVRKFVPVVPGPYTFHLTVDKTGSFTCDIINFHFTAMYIPTWISTAAPPTMSTSESIENMADNEVLQRLKSLESEH